jgi:hypothetical protein
MCHEVFQHQVMVKEDVKVEDLLEVTVEEEIHSQAVVNKPDQEEADKGITIKVDVCEVNNYAINPSIFFLNLCIFITA